MVVIPIYFKTTCFNYYILKGSISSTYHWLRALKRQCRNRWNDGSNLVAARSMF